MDAAFLTDVNYPIEHIEVTTLHSLLLHIYYQFEWFIHKNKMIKMEIPFFFLHKKNCSNLLQLLGWNNNWLRSIIRFINNK